MKISIVLVVHDPYDVFTVPEALPTAISSLDKLKGDFELVLVNNNEGERCPKTTSYLRQLANQRAATKLVENNANLGCSGGFNRGAVASSKDSDVLIYMSSDAMITDPDTLMRIEATFERYHKVGLAQPLAIYEDMPDYNASPAYAEHVFREQVRLENDTGVWADNSTEEIEQLNKIVTARPLDVKYPTWSVPLTFLAIRRSVFEQLGGFDESFLYGAENTDFILRALQRGYPAAVILNAFVFHRRLLFRHLGSAGKRQELAQEGGERAHKYWEQKWGRSPLEVYRELKYGSLLYGTIIHPAIQLARKVRQLQSILASPQH